MGLFNFVIYVFLIVMLCSYCYVYSILYIGIHRSNWHSSATLTEIFLFFFSVVRQKLGYNSQRWGTSRTFPTFIMLVYVFFVCKCVPQYSHRVSNQLQLKKFVILSAFIFKFKAKIPQYVFSHGALRAAQKQHK